VFIRVHLWFQTVFEMASRETVACVIAVALASAGFPAAGQERAIPLDQLKSGSAFAPPEIRALQQDDFANPATLWAGRGAKLWNERTGGAARACADCHGDAKASMRGVAARYPTVDVKTGKVVDLEGRIQNCRTQAQRAAPFKYESQELLGLAIFIAQQSRGMPLNVSIDGPARSHFEAGEEFFYARKGQVNLSCADCHEANWGRRLSTETISQGHPNAYPVYRMEWESAGSLQRRLRACLSGVRAEMRPYGSPEMLDLELFLAWRAQGLSIETPGVRR
jgi:sulfur-oxidizing protein SoxA